MKYLGLVWAGVNVEDLEASISFYQGVLGLPLLDRGTNWAHFDSGAGRFWNCSLVERPHQSPSGLISNPSSWACGWRIWTAPSQSSKRTAFTLFLKSRASLQARAGRIFRILKGISSKSKRSHKLSYGANGFYEYSPLLSHLTHPQALAGSVAARFPWSLYAKSENKKMENMVILVATLEARFL